MGFKGRPDRVLIECMKDMRVFKPHAIRGGGHPSSPHYREPNSTRSSVELAITAVPFVLLWILMWAA